MIKLKPCPFCGSNKVYKHDIALYETYGEGYVLCPECKAQTNFLIDVSPDIVDRDDVISRIVAMWNRRADHEHSEGE